MGYKFSATKASGIYIDSLRHIVTLPKNNNTKLLFQTATKELTATNELLSVVKAEMIRLAKELPEYETVHSMFGVGELLAAQLMAEIDDKRNYPRRSALVGFAGVDPEVNQSGKMNSESSPSTNCGSPHLRRTLFQLMTRHSPADEAVYQFLDKKRTDGNPTTSICQPEPTSSCRATMPESRSAWQS